MNESMVKRVARAHWEARRSGFSIPRLGVYAVAEWEGLPPDFQAKEIAATRAAIEAMRGAGLDVLGAGYNAMFEAQWDATQAPMMGAGWDAMITAALAETLG